MKVSYKIQKGIAKEKCDDAILVGEQIVEETVGSFSINTFSQICIGDGVGGNKGGDVASKYLMEKVAKMGSVRELTELKEKLLKINDSLLSYAKDQSGYETMASTFSGLFSVGENTALAHCGNTRIYALQGKFLKQITVDQTVYQWLLDTGNEEAAKYCNKNAIRSAFGGGDKKFIAPLLVTDVFERGWPRCILMTSDGIHDVLGIDLLEEIVSRNDICDLEKVVLMVEKATEQGSTDDCTVVLIDTIE